MSDARQSVGIAAQPPSGDGSYDGLRFTTNPFQSGAVQLGRRMARSAGLAAERRQHIAWGERAEPWRAFA
jgi:hypothetical protein